MASDKNLIDWSTSYSQYLARSAAMSARTLNRYQLALEHISQGKLPATIFQDHFPVFAAAHMEQFSKRFSEVASRFLSDMVRLGTDLARQPHAAPPDAEVLPPRFDASNPTRWYGELAEYAGQLNARALKAYRAQLDRVATGELTPSEAQQNATEQMSRDLPESMQLMTRAYFDLLNGLNDVRSAYEETYFQGLLAASRPEGEDPVIALTLAGVTGTTAVAALSVTNTTAEKARIGCKVLGARRVDGVGPSLVPNVAFTPEALELGRDEEGTLNVSLHLDPAAFDAGSPYAGKLVLSGASEVPLEVELRILATAAESHHGNSSHPA